MIISINLYDQNIIMRIMAKSATTKITTLVLLAVSDLVTVPILSLPPETTSGKFFGK